MTEPFSVAPRRLRRTFRALRTSEDTAHGLPEVRSSPYNRDRAPLPATSMLQRLVLSGLVLSLFAATALAQVEHGGRPPSLQKRLARPALTERMPPVRAELLQAEDAAQGAKGPLRFAEMLAVELGLANAGAWEELGRGDRVWRLRILSRGAKSLALVFKRFQLPAGGELYVYDDAKKDVRGAYTELENRLDGQFATRPLRGEALNLEYYEPARARGQGELVLGAVAHDYRDVLALLEQRSGGSGSSGSCEVDVACPLGASWQDQIDATVHVLSSGLLCSGSLLNNTANDGTVLVLSAAHCRGLANAVFTFNFERPVCGSGVAPSTNTIVGATQLAFDDASDVQLLRLNVPQAPQAFPVFLAGWDRSDVPPSSSVIIHHPAGDVKKISRDDDAPGKFQGFWRIFDWERGVTEGGSSGAPMFDPAGRFIGNLDSGSSSCQVPTDDDFATRLATAWSVLEPYLDPLATGQLTTDGLDLASVTPQPFHVSGVFPLSVEALVPGVLRTVRILGSGFTDATQVAVDGVALDPLRYVRGGHSYLNLDLPQIPLGPHLFSVLENGVIESAPFAVIAPAEPRVQVNEGIPGEPVFSFALDTLHSDTPGHVHYCYWSLSNLPSVHPLLTLGIGNNFTNLFGCRVTPIPAKGWVSVNHPVAFGMLPFGTHVFTQSACISHGRPLHVSNIQETEFQL